MPPVQSLLALTTECPRLRVRVVRVQLPAQWLTGGLVRFKVAKGTLVPEADMNGLRAAPAGAKPKRYRRDGDDKNASSNITSGAADNEADRHTPKRHAVGSLPDLPLAPSLALSDLTDVLESVAPDYHSSATTPSLAPPQN